MNNFSFPSNGSSKVCKVAQLRPMMIFDFPCLNLSPFED